MIILSDVFKFDDNYEQNEEEYKNIKKGGFDMCKTSTQQVAREDE